MTTEYWATFSIYDHRTPNYKRALLLFDKVVIPVATQPFRKLTKQELEQLSAEVDFLEKQHLAVRVNWDPQRFAEWKQDMAGKAISHYIGKDAENDTRLQLQYDVEQGSIGINRPQGLDVLAVPVCSSYQEFEHFAYEQNTLEIILNTLPVPSQDASLEAICRLREREDFATSLGKMRIWQDELVLELIRAGSERERDLLLRQGKAQLADWIRTYRRLVADAELANENVALTAISSVGQVLMGDLTALPKLIEMFKDLVTARAGRRPSWKAVADLECAPAGVIYATEEEFDTHLPK